ncbi:MAG: FecR domain-containing protein, partial [Sedimentisphaerales bacterium]|nr:FecR domain-containing protein [Sedimentisphaerales bacterium]
EELLREAIEHEERLTTEHSCQQAQLQKDEDEKIARLRLEEIKRLADEKFQEFLQKEQARLDKFKHQRYIADRDWRYFSIGVMAASLIIVVSALYFSRSPSIPAVPQVVATLTETLNAKWDDSTLPTTTGSELFAGEMRLIKGYAQITFIDGAKVVLQAPAQFKLETDEQMFLQSGRLTAKVPPGAEGFKLNTPNAMMIDLGTEFGVIVSEAGQSELHVFEGEVKLFSDKRTGGNIYKQTFRTGQAGVIDKSGQLSKKTYKATPRSFVRSIPEKTTYGQPGERVDLSDIISGGNGFGTGDPNQSINPDNGQIRPSFYSRSRKGVPGSSGYIPVAGLDFIDGVFVPDGGDGPVVVSSDGHTFNNCPDTSRYFCWDIFNGTFSFEGQCRQILDGIKYGTYSQPAISIHSNSGVTFDLDKIRASMPGSRIVALSTLCGLATNEYDSMADFWVLVDGQKRFSMTGAHWQDRAKPVRIILTEQDKFLTLMVTDGGKTLAEKEFKREANASDWGIFAEPALILAPAGRK